ncbi:phosphatase PAP2 family protein [Deinococcus altitudinis]|uniref:phosphatase PAP2 family protein n=1 Tax=Deinococcus altitudinis TaxID=468914 RepID=UPI0038921334
MFSSLHASARHIRPAALIRLLLGILIPLIVVGALGEDVLEKQRFAFESPFMLWLHAHSTPALDHLAVLLAYIGGVQVIAPVSAALLLLLWRRSRPAAWFFAVAVLGAALLNGAMKLAFQRPRPELWPRLLQESGASFPSGHSMYSAAFVTALILLAWPSRLRWPALILGVVFTGMVGWSRVDLGVHYPTDVLAGWLSGVAWVLGTYGLLRPTPLRAVRVHSPSTGATDVQNEVAGQNGTTGRED